MAGSQDPDENPIAVNVVPMVDVIFCLCVFFMCSFKFKEVEGRFDAWLPKDRGICGPTVDAMDDLRVALRWDERANAVTRQFGRRFVASDAELQQLLRDARADQLALNRGAPRPVNPLIIDAESAVPWRDVVDVINLCQRESIEKIEFAYGTGQ